MNNLNEKLLEAVKSNEIEEVKKLIKEGADVNVVDKYGKTALHKASYWGYSKIVKMLIEKGADVNMVDEYEITALYWASFEGHSEIVKMLEKAGAK